MKTTMYELLGMVKDGKAPKKIKFNRIYCYYRECKNEYVDYTNKPIIQWDYVVMNSLNDEVEIPEEPKGIPEKLITWYSVEEHQSLKQNCEFANCNFETMYDKINEILDYLESKGE